MTESLYIHIPFCSRKCDYCDFFSVPDADPSLIDAVLSETIRELDSFIEEGLARGFKTVYVGGGTPGIVKPDKLAWFLHAVSERLDTVPLEWSLETNPETVTGELLSVLSESGIRRLSVGIQSMNATLLRILGRNGTAKGNSDALEMIKQHWKHDLSLDLIHGIPYQTVDEALSDIDTVVGFRPDHLSLYTLSIEEETPLGNAIASGMLNAPNAETVEEMFFRCREKLATYGYDDYEVSNFSGEGKECIHNVSYWEMRPYLGIGPGAVSTVFRHGRIERLSHGSLSEFLSGRNGNWGLRTEVIDPRSFLFEHIMMGLRLKRGLSIKNLFGVFGFDILDECRELIESWRSRGLTIDSDRLYFKGEGRFILNAFLREFLASIEGKTVFLKEWPFLEDPH
ncbi:MAG TPA: radical SAM family heme chaperone HemW [Spirochaetia bacterium]|nr:radical SAM family heme chaperone HemW [Spirochaetia bacterium]